MGRATTWLVVSTLILASCTRASSSDITATSSTTGPPTSNSSAIDPGRLVILDGAGEVVLLDPTGSNRTAITDDAGASAVYTQPIWAPDVNKLAFGRATPDGFSVAIHDLGTGDTQFVTTRNLPFYMYFSPSGDLLGVLHNGTDGVDFNLVDVSAGTIETIDSGTPFYFSWNPRDDLLVTHVGADRVETIDSAGDRTPLNPTGPRYLAPHWTDRGVFHVVDDSLVVEDSSGIRTPVAEVSGFSMFVANTRGSRVAVQTAVEGGGTAVALSASPTIRSNRVVVVDVSTATAETVTEHLALGFFWSPDGDHLLTLMPGGDEIVPRVWSADGSVADYPGYLPQNSMLQDTFPFFPQYAQSVSFWAADSSAFAYAGVIEDESGIWVQSLAAGSPEMVSDGRWVAWSGSD